MPGIERLTAIKCTIDEIARGKYVSGTEKFDPNFIETDGLKISRANIIATVTATYFSEDKKYAFIVLDDSTGVIRSKAFQDTKPFANIKKGDIVCFIGKVREYNDERYLIPEIVKKLDDPNFETLRKLELLKRMGMKIQSTVNGFSNDTNKTGSAQVNNVSSTLTENTKTPISPSTNEKTEKKIDRIAIRETALKAIAEFDEGDGVPYDKILALFKDSSQEAESVINELLEEGSCYEPRPGKIKLL